ncbi:hypothetical protein BDL97_03G147900 [Sphagnum fallax]|nr:hypothetical protein BDL97_03G147900 [Sphagnum fallax]
MHGFLFFRYQHPTKNAKNKETCSQEELERSADAWATEFVEKNLRPQLTSWLQELDGFFPKQLPFGTSQIGRTCFTTMAVTENYHSTSHTDRDLSNSVISWFLEGEAESRGEFAFPTHGMFFKPRHGTIILFRSGWLQYCTMPVLDRRRQLGCALQTLTHYVARQADLSRINKALNESMRKKSCIRRRGKGTMGPLEGALRLTYRGGTINVYDEAGSSDESFE